MRTPKARKGIQNIMTMKRGPQDEGPGAVSGAFQGTAITAVTIGDHVVIQLDRLTAERAHMTISAPREIPILRGKVLEREGGERPGCVYDT